MTANGLTKAVIFFLKSKGYHVWRQNNMGVFQSSVATQRIITAVMANKHGLTAAKLGGIVKRILASSWRKNHTGQKGISDVIGWNRKTGEWIAVEVKIGRDELSPEQKSFLIAINEAGGEAYVAREYAQFVSKWEVRQKRKVINQSRAS